MGNRVFAGGELRLDLLPPQRRKRAVLNDSGGERHGYCYFRRADEGGCLNLGLAQPLETVEVFIIIRAGLLPERWLVENHCSMAIYAFRSYHSLLCLHSLPKEP